MLGLEQVDVAVAEIVGDGVADEDVEAQSEILDILKYPGSVKRYNEVVKNKLEMLELELMSESDRILDIKAIPDPELQLKFKRLADRAFSGERATDSVVSNFPC